MDMNKACLLFGAACLALGAASAGAFERPVVVELFTSEGCSSCPPADALLAELASRPEVLALSFHVDYWDRLGWKDPFSSGAATRRQHRYAELLGLSTVYTPQIVIDGKWQAVGSDRDEVERALGSAHRHPEEVPVTLAIDRGRARITMGGGQGDVSAAVLLIGFDRRHVTEVTRGENGGRTLTHIDVVRSIEEVAHFDGKASTVEASPSAPCDRVAVIVQAHDGRIIGAAMRDDF
jgi:hypothetical protein